MFRAELLLVKFSPDKKNEIRAQWDPQRDNRQIERVRSMKTNNWPIVHESCCKHVYSKGMWYNAWQNHTIGDRSISSGCPSPKIRVHKSGLQRVVRSDAAICYRHRNGVSPVAHTHWYASSALHWHVGAFSQSLVVIHEHIVVLSCHDRWPPPPLLLLLVTNFSFYPKNQSILQHYPPLVKLKAALQP